MSDATHEMPQQTWKFLTLGRAGVLAKILKRLRVRLRVCAAPIDVGEGELSLRCVLRSVKLVGKDRRIVPGTRGLGPGHPHKTSVCGKKRTRKSQRQ